MLNFLKKIREAFDNSKEKQSVSDAFRIRYGTFQQLLWNNNAVLELMADLEEKMSGEYLFDRSYINSTVHKLTEGVRNIVTCLNSLSDGKYCVLEEKFNEINAGLQKILLTRGEIPDGKYVFPFDEITSDLAGRVGPKTANLGEVRNRVRITTPNGFAISIAAYKRLMEHNGFLESFSETMCGLSLDNMEILTAVSRSIQERIINAKIPDDLEREIREAYEKLRGRSGNAVMSSVRSSALQEDADFSFAGQYSTFLNVPDSLLLRKYKEVIASLFTSRAIFYCKSKGFQECEMAMAVGVVQMVDARAAGVMYSRDPNDPGKDVVLISAVRGLGKSLVDGLVTPETYTVSRSAGEDIISRTLSVQKTMFRCRPEGDIEEVPVPGSLLGAPALADGEVATLARYALLLEEHFKCPQDIEWAVGRDTTLYILQSRPLTIVAQEPVKAVPLRVSGYPLLLDRGITACKGIGFGKAYLAKTDDDLDDFPEGAVLVAKHTSPKFVTVMNKARAIITDVGSATGHMASLSREFRVPTLLDTEKATAVIREGQEITVDAVNCNVYEGLVPELMELSKRKEEPFKGTQMFKILEKAIRHIVPLHLVDPADANFRAESCRTFHDITRFAHEVGMREMFALHNLMDLEEGGGIRFVAGIPTEVEVLDLGGGIAGNAPGHLKRVVPDDITSVPFKAFVKGMLSMRWPGPAPLDAKGFMGMVAQTATIPEAELAKTALKSFVFVSREYMNFAIRLGYHFSTVEAYAGESINDNYIKFFFNGGGAVRDRKLRRVRLITEILRFMDFRVKTAEDVIDAVLIKYKRATIEEKLVILGKLTAYTKQLDMVMYNDAVTDMYIEDFISEQIRKKEEG
ncbi:MAG: phosphoenolpyruvate synthase [Alphaproteobacteria bacterium]|uniref:Phosphoenolpyruvate synthase n=1 Tax=Candidatus Nitrobium versatile TaxID=2884831 RepID=A0A953J6J8_9BACT|nr:phosphoenolpyruvate synthase [Candidatus Nitrobium versatile]